MVTTTPNETVKPIHPDRMPVIVDQSDWEAWLMGSPDDAAKLLRPFPANRMMIIDSGEDMKSEPAS
ncbi:SOS response associated peptidase (SRAP) [Sulfitobacter brevis]|uniref:SOS response associated peptidase (SRAP) n=2 Tax=Sulfitobacter brevis TaxID=74348 RepID=A0A1I2FL01_9RHOB|nr:SOS response associated peptidase (SRAP) [Sulfitobacter brevis]